MHKHNTCNCNATKSLTRSKYSKAENKDENATDLTTKNN